MSRLEAPNPALAAESHALTVPVLTLDNFVRTNRTIPDLVLIDVEGFELRVLEGARSLIKDRNTHFVVEMHPALWSTANSSSDQIAAFLKEMQLRPKCLNGQHDTLKENGLVYL